MRSLCLVQQQQSHGLLPRVTSCRLWRTEAKQSDHRFFATTSLCHLAHARSLCSLSISHTRVPWWYLHPAVALPLVEALARLATQLALGHHRAQDLGHNEGRLIWVVLDPPVQDEQGRVDAHVVQ